jgi:hypothetical protein
VSWFPDFLWDHAYSNNPDEVEDYDKNDDESGEGEDPFINDRGKRKGNHTDTS